MAKAKAKETKPAAPAPEPAEPETETPPVETPAKETGVPKTLVAQACKDLKIDPESVETTVADGKALVLGLKASAGGAKVRWEPKE